MLNAPRGALFQLGFVDRILTDAGEPHTFAMLYPLPDAPIVERWCITCTDRVSTDDTLVCPWCESQTLEPRAEGMVA
jgi:hypothetical protein